LVKVIFLVSVRGNSRKRLAVSSLLHAIALLLDKIFIQQGFFLLKNKEKKEREEKWSIFNLRKGGVGLCHMILEHQCCEIYERIQDLT
jgi:hypothetical protein